MKIAVIGATGYVGGAIAQEALDRGHAVTAISRRPSEEARTGRLHPVAADIDDTAALAAALRGHDVVIHAYNPGRGRTDPDIFDLFVAGHKAILRAVEEAGVQRLLCVGGAGSLLTREGVPLLDSSEWPKEFDAYKDGVRGTRELYYLLKETSGVDWVFLAPASILTPDGRTGSYRVGKDHLLYDANGESRISTQDYAVAMIDELERPAHHRERFTVGY